MLFYFVDGMFLAAVNNEESCRVSVVRGICVGTDGHPYLIWWAAAVCKWATGSGCDGQHRGFALSLRQHTHRPPTVRSLTSCMHIEHKNYTSYIFKYITFPVTLHVGQNVSFCLNSAALGQNKLQFGLDFMQQVQSQAVWANHGLDSLVISGSCWLSLSQSL